MIGLLKQIQQHRHALKALTSVEVKTSVASTRVGIFWWILDPLIMMMIYYFVIGVVFNRGGPNYHLFVLCGIISWRFFSSSVVGSCTSIFSNRALILQIGVPLPLFVLTQPLVRMFFAAFGIGIVMIWNYHMLGLHTFGAILLLLAIAFLSFGIGLYLAVVSVYIADINKMITYILRAGFFLSPVLFSPSRIMESEKIPEYVKTLYGYNPMAWIMTSLRKILLEGQMFDWGDFFILVIFIAIIIQIGLIWLRFNTPRIVKML